MLPHSFQLCGKCDAAFLHAGADGAVVGFCDALGDGEADAEAAGLGAAGGVGIDSNGDLNVSKFGTRLAGAGGFIDITQNAKKVVYCGTFTAKGLKTECRDGALVITQEGAKKKFVQQVEHITFSGKYAVEVGQPVLYITERAVFELRPDGVTLIEIAPGIDLQTQVLDQMEFMPMIADDLKLMDERIFREELMGLAND